MLSIMDSIFVLPIFFWLVWNYDSARKNFSEKRFSAEN